MEKTIEIPEGYEARIEGNKVILEPKESEDERIRNLIYCLIRDRSDNRKLLEHNGVSVDDALAYLERQKGIVMHTPRYAPPEQKPAEWSLTDATFIEEIDETLFMAEAGRNEVVKNQIERERNWLKSLQERFNFQPKIEWSKEDKRCFDEAIEALESLGFDGEASNLKSLRDNYKKCNSRWKPSDEQMAALLNAEGLVRANNYPENAKILASLYEDLKKL